MIRRQPDTTTWRCSKCNKRKPVRLFDPTKNTASGFTQPCKLCVTLRNRIKNREWRNKNRRKARASIRAYHRRNRVVLRQRAKQRAKDYPAQARARRIVYFGVRWGFIKKPKHCSLCGKRCVTRALQAHHTDYAKPTLVTWLCALCHGLQHRK